MNKSMSHVKNGGSAVEYLRKWALVIVVIVLGIIFSCLSPSFMTADNILNILRQTAIMGVLAIGLTFVIVAGEIDLSFSMVASLTAVVVLLMSIQGINAGLSWIVAILLGIAMGLFNAFVVVKLKISSMLGTIGTQLLYGGIVAWIAKGGTIWTAKYSVLFQIPGRGMLFGIIPFPVVILIAVAVVAVIILEKTVLGRYFYAVGGNAKAADHAGINAKRIKTYGYLFLGALGGLAGIIIASQFASATPSVGATYLFPAIIAVYLGSIFLKDGVPNLWGTLVACIFLSELSNGFNLLGLKYWHEDVTQGVIMIIAIALMIAGKVRKAKSQQLAEDEKEKPKIAEKTEQA